MLKKMNFLIYVNILLFKRCLNSEDLINRKIMYNLKWILFINILPKNNCI
jgi:hypothetical protein